MTIKAPANMSDYVWKTAVHDETQELIEAIRQEFERNRNRWTNTTEMSDWPKWSHAKDPSRHRDDLLYLAKTRLRLKTVRVTTNTNTLLFL